MKINFNTVIVITGASSGVGRAMAIELARHQCRLILAARRANALLEVANECTSLGANAHVVVADTRIADDMRRLVQTALELTGTIDVWINNAGVLAAGALEDVPAFINEEVIRTNLLGYMNGAQQVLPYFKARKRGIIINNISVGGWLPTPYATAYSASKFGLRAFSEALKGELNHYPDIHIVDLYPGFLDTPGMQHAANYTGKALKPAPPVGDPRAVAKAVIDVINRPRSRKTIGAPSALLRIAYAVLPAFTRNTAWLVIRKYLQQARPIEHTAGNVQQPVDYGTGIDGGWRLAKTGTRAPVAIALAAALATGFWVYRKSL